MRLQKGFTLIETLIASTVLIIFITAVLTIIQIILTSLGEARVRSMAIQLAQDQIELARNMPYDRLGTLGGIPEGDLISHQVINKLGAEFVLDTVVLFIDDTFDEVAPGDLIPNDYKRVRVNVAWKGVFTSKKPVVLAADISPQGIEQDAGGGTLSVLVFNSLGQPVHSAKVHIDAPSLSPPVLIDTYTDINGRVIIPGAPVCDSCYKITVTKDGYSEERTYGREEIANPHKPHLSIIESKVSEVSFAIDQLASLVIRATRSEQAGYSAFTGANFIITGSKELGRSAEDDPVYKTIKSVTTSTGGVITVNGLEWDRYTISVPSNSTIDIAGSWPFNPVAVIPGQSTEITVIIEASSQTSYLIQVEDEGHQPLSEVEAELKRPGFIATDSSGLAGKGDWSQLYFKNLPAGAFELLIRSDGYETATASVSLTGDKQERFILLKNLGE